MRTDKNKHLYDKLKESRPSMLRMSILTWLLWLVGNLVALACVILGAAIYIDTTAGKKILSYIKNTDTVTEAETGDRSLSLFLATIFIIAGILFYTIAFLSRRLTIRNNYIGELEQLMDDEMNKPLPVPKNENIADKY